jgi:hypothetical protein
MILPASEQGLRLMELLHQPETANGVREYAID